jgi:hypothetical protein
MKRIILLSTVGTLAFAVPARAELPVTDFSSLGQLFKEVQNCYDKTTG